MDVLGPRFGTTIDGTGRLRTGHVIFDFLVDILRGCFLVLKGRHGRDSMLVRGRG